LKPFLLVVDAGGGEEQVQALVQSLQLDGVTARLVARSNWWRVARGGESREPLEELAEDTRRATDLQVSVLAATDLAQVPAPRGLMGATEDGLWSVTKPGWQGEEEEAVAVKLSLASFSLAVPGSIVIRRFRHRERRERSSRKMGTIQHEGRQRRVGVLDLHGPDESLRLVSGVTNFSRLPGDFQGTGPRSFSLFQSWLEQELEVLGRRICEPLRSAPGTQSEDNPSEFQITGWPVWEEYSRICALHLAHRR
jgi:hypothetical protein